ncbi:uncharacterized protein TNCV_3197161 [Trichonephila clavipes]|nr:uncharacterized protein TNCV_3197161 [Trichonephila clavipes]
MKSTQKLETWLGCDETQEESIRTGPESVVANGLTLAREKKTKLTSRGAAVTILIGRTIESSRCGRPRWHRIRVITGEALWGEHRRGPIPRKACTNKKIWWTSKNQESPNLNSLGEVKFFPVPIGLTSEHDILVLKSSPCIHNGNKVDDWMGLDE